MATKIQLRHDSADKWIEINPILLPGEVGIELDTKKFKIGDGSTNWNDLDYAVSGASDGAIGNVDGISIIANEDGTISSNAVIDQNSGFAKTWTGTLAQYNLIETKDTETLYYITDDIVSADEVISLDSDLNGLSEAGKAKFDAKANINLDNLSEDGLKVISENSGGGLEIGDIGFTQMAIDETKGKRRILNGQLIIQEQYVQFTNIIKDSVALNPNLACTESEWQTAVTMSANGVCEKFVIDDEAGTIRLPKYPTYLDLSINTSAVSKTVSIKGNGKAMGFMGGADGTTTGGLVYTSEGLGVRTGMYNQPLATKYSSGEFAINYTAGLTTDASKSGITGSVSIPAVQSEKIKGTYFIQVATGAETEDNIINEIELNNPFSLLDYKYSEYELNNLSWLRSQGQYNSKAVYPAVYDLLLKIYNGVETKAGVSVKLSTEAFTDYDFVLNTAEETFRLPIITKNRVLIAKKEATNQDTTWYNLYSDGWCEQGGQTSGYTTIQLLKSFSNTLYYVNFISLDNANTSQYENYMVSNKTTSSFTIGQKRTGLDGGVCNWVACGYAGIPTENNYLYFYVGETVQNANLINAGRIEEKLSNKLDARDVKAYITETYVNGASWYRVWSDGWIEQGGYFANNATVENTINLLKVFTNADYFVTKSFVGGYSSLQIETQYLNIGTKTTTSFNTKTYNTDGLTAFMWYACGY